MGSRGNAVLYAIGALCCGIPLLCMLTTWNEFNLVLMGQIKFLFRLCLVEIDWKQVTQTGYAAFVGVLVVFQ